MARTRTVWVCSECGFAHSRWNGQCANCGAWNTLKETAEQKSQPVLSGHRRPVPPVFRLEDVPKAESQRLVTGIHEFDRVLGGGVLPGGVVLAGGAPGIGKSTLLLQAARAYSEERPVLYISGEESPVQIKVRARRLGIEGGIRLMAETDLGAVIAGIEETKPEIVIVDSIQTLRDPQLPGMPGTVSQVRSCAGELSRIAKQHAVATFMIGHVTKEGTLAGPRVLEHLVDTVLNFESEKNSDLRILRAVKNRFGSTDEIGLFEMRDNGMQPLGEASFLFENTTGAKLDGTAVFCGLQGNRPLLLEIQALCARSSQSVPRRTASGIDSSRLVLICAVLEKKLGFRLGADDVFVNAAGGIRIHEHAADLALAVAIVSSLRGKPVAPDTAFIGEVGLSGEIRRVGGMERRLAECSRLGIRRVIVPKQGQEKMKKSGMTEIVPVSTLFEAFEKVI